MLNLRVNLGDLALVALTLSHQGGKVIARDQGKLSLKFAFLVFDDFIDVAHRVVVDFVTLEKSGAI